jgi:putative membrane protein
MANALKTVATLFVSSAIVLACNNKSATSEEDKSTVGTSTTVDSISNPSALSEADAKFLMNAVTSGMMQVDAGNVAIANSSSKEIRDFAQMIVSDHTAANDELYSVAATKNAILPSGLSGSERQHINDMKNMKGNDFDDHYKKMMVDEHQKAVDMFEDASKNCNDADLKAWAAKTLPRLKSHLDAAKALK